MQFAADLGSAPSAYEPSPRWVDRPQPGSLASAAGLSELSHIPGRAGLPLVGIMPEAMLNPLRWTEQMYERFGPVHRFYACGSWNVQLIGPEANELVLFDRQNLFSAEGGWHRLIGGLFPGALLLKDGADHRASRRILGEAFKPARVEAYQRIFANDIERAVESWQGKSIDIYAEARRLTLSIAVSTFLGLPDDIRAPSIVRALADMVDGVLATFQSPWLSPTYARAVRGKRRLEALIAELIRDRRRAPGEDIFSRICLLRDDEGALLSEHEIQGVTIFLLSAAQDTLSSALTSTADYLARYPIWAERLRSEAEDARIDDIASVSEVALPFHDMVFKEALRLNAPAPVVWRRARQPFSIYGFDIPANAMVAVNPLLTHRLESIWPEPDRFNPMRFTAAAEARRHRFAYVPFGGGVHKCLGMHFAQQQARIFMVALLRRSTLAPANAMPVAWTHWPNAKPRAPLAISVTERIPGR
ncbi:cytochrome P450 [Sphingomonas sp. DBB INV C78]|uniref:cytochrome P450 n=1 Tax=Sphingomonas sp. DBB INV C78 TaxID=3349434 RepID=UPI0036D2719D